MHYATALPSVTLILSLSHLPLLLCLALLKQEAQDLTQYLHAQTQLITVSQMDTEMLTAC